MLRLQDIEVVQYRNTTTCNGGYCIQLNLQQFKSERGKPHYYYQVIVKLEGVAIAQVLKDPT